MASPPYHRSYPQLVNSKKSITPDKDFTRDFINDEKKPTGAIVVTRDVASDIATQYGGTNATNGLKGFDLMGRNFIGSCVLIDYNYVLTCFHVFKLLSDSHMTAKKVTVIFANEYTEATVDTNARKAEKKTPMAYLRGDLEWWGPVDSSECNDDFALVKIEWHQTSPGVDDYHMAQLQHMAILPDPDKFDHTKHLINQKLCGMLQYSISDQKEGRIDTAFSTHFAWGYCKEIDIGPKNNACMSASKRPYYATVDFKSRNGSSGSAILNIKGELVGILQGQVRNYTSFLPIDYIYKSKTKGARTTRTTETIMREIYTKRKSDGMKPRK